MQTKDSDLIRSGNQLEAASSSRLLAASGVFPTSSLIEIGDGD